MQEQVDRMSYTQRLSVVLLGIFGGVALLVGRNWSVWRDVLRRDRRVRASLACAWLWVRA